MNSTSVHIHDEVRDALREHRAVVAFESTIFSHLGLPSPHNAEALARCVTAVRDLDAVPAITAVLDGVAHVGLDPAVHDRILGPSRKVSEREIAVAVAQHWSYGATTVSAALLLAAAAGIGVFSTGGIGGVHRGADRTGDISADLGAIAAHPVVTVCAGAKGFLDLSRTLEHLEMLGVPVLGLATDEFPSFTLRTSGLPIPTRVDSVREVAEIVATHRDLGRRGGVLLAVPIPEQAALAPHDVEQATTAALADATARGIKGPAVTPFVLERLVDATGGRTIAPNLALAENNARIAAELAQLLATR